MKASYLQTILCLSLAAGACDRRASGAGDTVPIVSWDQSARQTLVQLGSDEERPGHAFHRIASAYVSPSNEVVVADQGSATVRVFSSDGELSALFGGVGGGPEEFAALAAAWPRADTIMTFDANSIRAAWWTLSGTLIRDATLAVRSAPKHVSQLDDGTFFGIVTSTGSMRRTDGEIRVDSARIVHFSPRGEVIHEVATVPFGVTVMRLAPIRGGVMMESGAPLSPDGVWGRLGSRIVHGFGSEPYLLLVDPYTSVIDTVPLPLTPQPISPEVIDDWVRPLVERAEPGERRSVEEFFRAMPFPEHLPLFDGLIIDQAGIFWIREFPRPGRETPIHWLAVDVSGTPLLKLLVPPAVHPQFIDSDRMVSVVTDTLGRELIYVTDLSITRQETAAANPRPRCTRIGVERGITYRCS